jgi:hypothetical protein
MVERGEERREIRANPAPAKEHGRRSYASLRLILRRREAPSRRMQAASCFETQRCALLLDMRREAAGCLIVE